MHAQLNLNLAPKDAIKIAILDSGLDMSHSMIRARKRRVLNQKSFLSGNNSTDDDHGHGTHIANLVFEVAPHACVIIARVTKGSYPIFRRTGAQALRKPSYGPSMSGST